MLNREPRLALDAVLRLRAARLGIARELALHAVNHSLHLRELVGIALGNRNRLGPENRLSAPLAQRLEFFLVTVARHAGNRVPCKPRIALVGERLAPSVRGELLEDKWIAKELCALFKGVGHFVIHRKDDKKIDHHIKKKKDIKEKLSKDYFIVTDKNRIRALKNSYMQQGQSVKTKNKSLFLSKDSMASEIGKAGLERMSDEIDGGSEIKDAAYTASYITSPAKEATMYAIQSTATQGAELARRQFRKRIIEKQKQKLKKVNVKDKILAKSSRSTAESAAKYGAKTAAKGAAKTAAKEKSPWP